MGRRLPRRVWHTVAALVPLPLIGLGYVAAVPGNPVAFQIELYLAGNGSAQALTHQAEVAPSACRARPRYCSAPAAKGQGPTNISCPTPSPPPASSSSPRALTGDPGATGALWRRSEVNGAIKGDRLKPTSSAVALRGSVSGADGSLADERGCRFSLHLELRRRCLPAVARGDRLPPDPRGD